MTKKAGDTFIGKKGGERVLRSDPNDGHLYPERPGNKTGCFIATVTYGDKNCSQVQFLYAFRDEVLLHSRSGRFLTWLYYKTSPFAACFIERVPLLKRLARNILERVIRFIERHTSIKQNAFRENHNWHNG